MKIPRMMIAAAASGSGKTVVTCALLAVLKSRGLHLQACKCGPDYIDPLFDREVLEIPSENLDLFFTEPEQLRHLFMQIVSDNPYLPGGGADLVLTEGVMGYYDGMSMGSDRASSYEVSKVLEIPVILVIPCKGAALSIVPQILGMLEFRKDAPVGGIILNHVSGMLYPKLKHTIETELKKKRYSLPVIGYVPDEDIFHIESRHLGLVLPEEIAELKKRLKQAGERAAETIDLDALLEIAQSAPELKQDKDEKRETPDQKTDQKVRIGVARDAAFCFYYEDNLRILRELGCDLVSFSPLYDQGLPEGVDGLLLGGGYPELYVKELSENIRMKQEIRQKIETGCPCIAECGGFLYLQNTLEGTDGKSYSMTGVLPGTGYRTERLGRFGYITLTAEAENPFLKAGESIRGHEFHYWDCTENGNNCLAVKPSGNNKWNCVCVKKNLFAGFPHLSFRSNPAYAERFVQQCRLFGDSERIERSKD